MGAQDRGAPPPGTDFVLTDQRLCRDVAARALRTARKKAQMCALPRVRRRMTL